MSFRLYPIPPEVLEAGVLLSVEIWEALYKDRNIQVWGRPLNKDLCFDPTVLVDPSTKRYPEDTTHILVFKGSA